VLDQSTDFDEMVIEKMTFQKTPGFDASFSKMMNQVKEKKIRLEKISDRGIIHSQKKGFEKNRRAMDTNRSAHDLVQ
jgi:hypothetical protein